jgi:hypothetical protein
MRDKGSKCNLGGRAACPPTCPPKPWQSWKLFGEGGSPRVARVGSQHESGTVRYAAPNTPVRGLPAIALAEAGHVYPPGVKG